MAASHAGAAQREKIVFVTHHHLLPDQQARRHGPVPIVWWHYCSSIKSLVFSVDIPIMRLRERSQDSLLYCGKYVVCRGRWRRWDGPFWRTLWIQFVSFWGRCIGSSILRKLSTKPCIDAGQHASDKNRRSVNAALSSRKGTSVFVKKA